MLLMNPIGDAGTAAEYFGQSDGGYYLDGRELRREWGGKGAALLGLDGRPEFAEFERLLNGLHPKTGEPLTALVRGGRVPGWDFTARPPKGVTAAIEGGDGRVLRLFHQAAAAAMEDVQALAATRVRKGGQDADRATGNMVWLMVEHPEARPAREDGKSDWDRHLHFIVANATRDAAEGRWKALKVHDIFRLRKYFSHRFDLRLAAGLAELGYALDTRLKAGRGGGMVYETWDIQAAPGFEAEWRSVNAVKMSRRHQDIKDAEERIVAARKGRDAAAPDALSAAGRYKLSATTRLGKREDMTLPDLRAYWDSRLAGREKEAIAATIDRARRGLNPRPKSRAAEARAHAMAHHFHRRSVVDFHDLAVTAIEKAIGAARPEDFEPDAWRGDGLLFQGDEASTQGVLDQEQRIIGFARAGRGKFRPLAPDRADGLHGLSQEQAAAVRHVWDSRDRVMLIRGAPGAGKTTMMRPALDRLGVPAVLLAPSADASRGKLREDGFADADTVAAFLASPAMQEQARGGLVWIDEASLLPIDDLERLCRVAQEKEARLVLQGDPRQHKSPQRHGNMLEVLADYAGLKVAEIAKIQRQKGRYAKAVEAIRAGEYEEGVDLLYELGWIVEGEGHDKLVERYAREAGGGGEPILIIDPTHSDGDALTEKLREARKAAGAVSGEERAFARWIDLQWTPAERGDANRYAGDEAIRFFRSSGPFKAGQRVTAAELLPHLARGHAPASAGVSSGGVKPEHFAVYREGEVRFAVGDVIRITAGGRDVTGKHRVSNGRIDTVAAFGKGGGIKLASGWELAPSFAHWKHGLVSTSPASQSKDRAAAWQQLNRAALGAAGAEQFLVSLSRGKRQGLVFTDLSREELIDAIRRADDRKSATELFKARPMPPARAATAAASAAEKGRTFLERLRQAYREWRRRAASAAARIKDRREESEASHGR